MELSIIIINFRVADYLIHCLCSLEKAIMGIETEIWVVDNHSGDTDVEQIKRLFPAVNLIENKINTGFASANNQALKLVNGTYVLFLNPDTLVSEDAIKKCLQFMKTSPLAGAVGPYMVDGQGKYLPESKRSKPTGLNIFFKLTGLSSLLNNSGIFNQYGLGQLDKSKQHEVPVLTGAFLFARKDVLDKIGGFDEQFFMYGEDIDLCIRIMENGYRNYYLPSARLIHFKGKSAHKNIFRKTYLFYRATWLYIGKRHFFLKWLFLPFICLQFIFGVIGRIGLFFFRKKNALNADQSAYMLSRHGKVQLAIYSPTSEKPIDWVEPSCVVDLDVAGWQLRLANHCKINGIAEILIDMDVLEVSTIIDFIEQCKHFRFSYYSREKSILIRI